MCFCMFVQWKKKNQSVLTYFPPPRIREKDAPKLFVSSYDRLLTTVVAHQCPLSFHMQGEPEQSTENVTGAGTSSFCSLNVQRRLRPGHTERMGGGSVTHWKWIQDHLILFSRANAGKRLPRWWFAVPAEGGSVVPSADPGNPSSAAGWALLLLEGKRASVLQPPSPGGLVTDRI